MYYKPKILIMSLTATPYTIEQVNTIVDKTINAYDLGGNLDYHLNNLRFKNGEEATDGEIEMSDTYNGLTVWFAIEKSGSKYYMELSITDDQDGEVLTNEQRDKVAERIFDSISDEEIKLNIELV